MLMREVYGFLSKHPGGGGPEEMKAGGLLLVRSRALVVEECWLNVALVPAERALPLVSLRLLSGS